MGWLGERNPTKNKNDMFNNVLLIKKINTCSIKVMSIRQHKRSFKYFIVYNCFNIYRT